ncbi:MAG: ATP-dependent DNA ligase [Verrucomicrobiota bacterium]|nr:ATP-dependent DNA ligase [Verrucomicrobiota bacterium]
MSALDIQFHRGGVFLPKLGLWLDPHLPIAGPEQVFISHAHSDHTGIHREIIVSEPTSRLMHARIAGEWSENILPFGTSRQFKATGFPYNLTLLPAGHIFGSAMSLVEVESSSLLYTGDFKLRQGLSAEKCEPRKADILIMETTYGRPHYKFPPTPEVIRGVIRFCREALDNDETAVLLGYSLGKSQELLCGLADAGLPIMLHGTVHKLTKIYEQFGQCFPAYEKYESSLARGKVLLCPPNVSNSNMLRNLGRCRIAVLTGWAVDPNCRFRYNAHAAFPLSDHADFTDLISLVEQVQPKKIYTLHGFAAEFAQTLRERGYDAQALSQEEQLSLPLTLTPPKKIKPPSRETDLTPVRAQAPQPLGFAAFATTCAAVGSTTKKLEKTRILADYFKTLDRDSLLLTSVWFTGVPFPSSQNKILQLGWAVIRDSLCAISGMDQGEFGQIYLKHSDLGETTFEVLQREESSSQMQSVKQTGELFDALLAARGPIAKLPLLTRALRESSPLEGKYLVKILTGDLRIGLKEGLVEDAIAQAFEAPLDKVKSANLLLGHIGETAVLAQHQQLNSASLVPYRPVKYMLASPEETAADIWQRVIEWHDKGRARNGTELPLPNFPADHLITVWVEDKYDGIRAQLHKVGNAVAIYSRDLKEITSTFLEVADKARKLEGDFILDGEIVGMRGEQVLPYSELQKRLGRKEGDLFMGEQLPVQLVVFDLLWINGENLLDQPLAVRRARLEKIEGSAFRLARITRVHSSEEIEEAFTAARARDNEGLIIKEPSSVYTPGRRGLAWLKLKKAFATLDCVVVGAEYGHGKRKDVLSDYTFAVRDDKTGELKTIGKAYSGLTDVEIAQLTSHFLKRVEWQKGRFHAVKPDTVLEIAFDLIQPSSRHSSGLAMRFPRIIRIRTDKTINEIDTLATATALVKPAR